MKTITVTVFDHDENKTYEMEVEASEPDHNGKIRAAVGEFLTKHIGPYKYKASAWINKPRDND
jgi:hypothetical protein